MRGDVEPAPPRRRCRRRRPTSCAASPRGSSPGEGDHLPVSALPADGVFPTGTARYEKRAIAHEIPIWDPTLCIDCGKCAMACPHAAIRMKVYPPDALRGRARRHSRASPSARASCPTTCSRSRSLPTTAPAAASASTCARPSSKEESKHKALNMAPADAHRERERERFAFFLALPELEPGRLDPAQVKNVADARAALRVLGRLRRLRRDAVPEAPVAALRRPAARRERDRLLVDLRRQPADDALGGERRRAAGRPGRTRCSRTTPSSASACGSPSSGQRARGAPPARGARAPARRGRWRARSSTRPDATTPRSPRQRERVARAGAAGSAALGDPRARACSRPGQRPRAQERLDRGRRRLGLRHRLAGPRPRARLGPRRERAGARHAGLLEHRRPGLEGDAARRRREVRARAARRRRARTWA